MKKILNHMVLAFIFATQMMFLQGCAHRAEALNCKCNCEENTFECTNELKENRPEAVNAVF